MESFGLQQLLMSFAIDRKALGISQSRLARMSGVSRFKICKYELGDGSLTLDEQREIRLAIYSEAERLRKISIDNNNGSSEDTSSV